MYRPPFFSLCLSSLHGCCCSPLQVAATLLPTSQPLTTRLHPRHPLGNMLGVTFTGFEAMVAAAAALEPLVSGLPPLESIAVAGLRRKLLIHLKSQREQAVVAVATAPAAAAAATRLKATATAIATSTGLQPHVLPGEVSLYSSEECSRTRG